MEVAIKWRGGGELVQVAGDFNNWQPKDLVKEGGTGVWGELLKLEPGTYNYKYLVDGVWKHDEDGDTVVDKEGNVNNVVIVEKDGGEASGDSDSWEMVDTEKEVTQKVSVVERLFELGDSSLELLGGMGGEMVKETKYQDLYFDTEDYQLLRKGVWVRRRGEGSWQMRWLEEEGV